MSPSTRGSFFPVYPNAMTDQISLAIPAQPSSAADARSALDRIEGRVEAPVLDDMKLLVTELVTNSVRHAGTGEEAQVELTVQVAADRVRVEVTDEGSGFRLDRRLTGSVSAEAAGYTGPERRSRPVEGELRTGGWGLYLVERISTRWGVHRGHPVRVWFELDRAPGASAAAG